MDDYHDGGDGGGRDHDENDNDDDASMSLECGMSESNEPLAQIASELEMIQRLQDAECQHPLICIHTWAMHQSPGHAK